MCGEAGAMSRPADPVEGKGRPRGTGGGSAVGPVARASAVSPLEWMLGLLLLLAAVLALRATSWFTGPLAFAFFVALAVWPIDAAIGARLPHGLRWLGHLAAMLVILLVFAAFLIGITYAGQRLAAGLPEHREALVALLESLAAFGERLGLPIDSLRNVVSADRLIEPAVGFLSSLVNAVWQTAGVLTLALFLILFMLIEAPVLRRKVAAVTTWRGNVDCRQVLVDVAGRFRRYLLVRAFLGLLTGVLYAAWAWWWDLPFVIVMGTLAFLLNFVPTVGSIIAGAVPMAIALLRLEPASAAIVAGGILVIEQVLGNYVDPKLLGRQMSLSGLVVLVALMFWTWVWGLLGALLAVPMTLLLMVVAAHVPALRPIALFLSDAPDVDEMRNSLGGPGK